MDQVNTSTASSSAITFEQPLNERIRTFMRVEELYARCKHYGELEGAWDTHFALSTLLEIASLAGRGDLKRELMKEIKRQLASLEQLHNVPHVDKITLEKLIHTHNNLLIELDDIHGQLIGHLKDNDFINSIKQRAVIPGGTCDFDLPAYHYWLTQTAASRKKILHSWLQPFENIHKAVVHSLNLIRDSAETESCLAAKGFYQRNLDSNQPNQLIRVIVDKSHQCFPEISAGKHRFSIRFLMQTTPELYPKQVDQDIQFKIVCCSF